MEKSLKKKKKNRTFALEFKNKVLKSIRKISFRLQYSTQSI